MLRGSFADQTKSIFKSPVKFMEDTMVPGDDLQFLSLVQGMPVSHTISSYIDFPLLFYGTSIFLHN